VAVPTGRRFAIFNLGILYHSCFNELGIQLCMAADTIFHYCGITCCSWPYGLRFYPDGKNSSVIQTILSLKGVTSDNVVLRHVAVIAGCPGLVGALLPGLIIGSHNVTIDTGRRIIEKIGGHPRDIKQIDREPCNGPKKNYKRKNQPAGESLLHSLSFAVITNIPKKIDLATILYKHQNAESIVNRYPIVLVMNWDTYVKTALPLFTEKITKYLANK